MFARKKKPSTAPLADMPPMRLKQCRHGLFLYNIHDEYVGRSLDIYGEMSEFEASLFQSILKPGQIALDVGANIGAHTVVMAKAVGPTGKVYAFEPQRIIFQTLCANIALNNLANVDALCAGAGEKPGTVIVPPVDYGAQGNFGGVSLGAARAGETVPLLTIDGLNLPRCDFIKVDVEGMERDVLQGARKTLQRFKPVLYVENDRPDKSPALIHFLLGADYRIFWDAPPMFNPGNYFGAKDNVFWDAKGRAVSSINMLGIHKNSDFAVPAGASEITAVTANQHPLAAG